jgi:hypothetical protein
MLAEGLRGALSPPASAPALLQRGVPEGGTEMVAVESAEELPGDGGGPAEAEWAKPALPGAGPELENPRESGDGRGREGNH